jgi:hypothetical protein
MLLADHERKKLASIIEAFESDKGGRTFSERQNKLWVC